MATTSYDPHKRYSTRHRGVSYRERRDGKRSYSVYFKGQYVPAGDGGRSSRTASRLSG